MLWLLLTNCLSVFDHFPGLALKGLNFRRLKKMLNLQKHPHIRKYGIQKTEFF